MKLAGAWRQALRSRDGRLLVAAFAALTVAEWMIAASFAVYLLEVGGQAAVGLLAVLYIPTAIAGPIAGTLSEHRPPERILPVTALSRAIVVGAAAAALAAGWALGVVAAILAVDAMVAAAYRPAQAAVLPFMARSPDELGAIAGVLSTTRTVLQAAGLVIGGLLIATISLAAVFTGATALFALAALLTGALGVRTEVIARRPGGPTPPGAAGGDGLLAAARQGLSAFAAIAGHANSRLVIELAGLRTAVRGAWLGLAVLAAEGFLHMGTSGFGQLAAAAGVGAVIAVPAASLLVGSPRLATALGASLAVVGLTLVGVAALATPAAALVLLVLWGVGMALADLSATAVLPRVADARRLGQMTAVTESLKQGAEGCGTLLVPVLAAALGARGAIAAGGAATALFALAAWRKLSRVDSAAGRRVARIELIRQVPLLAALRVVELETVAAALKPGRIAPEQEVIREGDRDARTFYVIESGTAEVFAGGHLLRTLGSGQSFGEIALLHGIQRTATVRARTALGLLELDRSQFIWALTGSEHSGLVRRPPSPDTDLASGSLHNALQGVPWIARLGSTVVRQLADRARRNELAAGETLWEQGAPGDTMGIVLAGEVTVEQGGNVEGSIGPGGWVGEVALLHEVPRTATVRAITPVVLCEVRRADVLETLEMEGHPPARILEQLA